MPSFNNYLTILSFAINVIIVAKLSSNHVSTSLVSGACVNLIHRCNEWRKEF